MITDVKGTTFTIEITVTDNEAEFLHKELHKVYKALKDEEKADDEQNIIVWEERRKHLGILRAMRNTFALLVNTHYMGEDA